MKHLKSFKELNENWLGRKVSDFSDSIKDIISLLNIPILPKNEMKIRRAWQEYQDYYEDTDVENFKKIYSDLF